MDVEGEESGSPATPPTPGTPKSNSAPGTPKGPSAPGTPKASQNGSPRSKSPAAKV